MGYNGTQWDWTPWHKWRTMGLQLAHSGMQLDTNGIQLGLHGNNSTQQHISHTMAHHGSPWHKTAPSPLNTEMKFIETKIIYVTESEHIIMYEQTKTWYGICLAYAQMCCSWHIPDHIITTTAYIGRHMHGICPLFVICIVAYAIFLWHMPYSRTENHASVDFQICPKFSMFLK